MVEGQRLINFSAQAFDDSWRDSDWLFFYSRRGVQYFDDVGQALPHHKIGCIGPQTAAYCTEIFGRAVDLIGNSDGPHTATMLLQQLTEGEVVCFLRASNSLKSVQRHLPQKSVQDLVCYNNEPKIGLEIPLCDIAVLTSPLNARTWAANYRGDLGNVRIIAIGRSTSHTLNGLGLCHQVSREATEASIVKTIKDLS